MKHLLIVIVILAACIGLSGRDIYSPLDINAVTLSGKWQTVGMDSYINIYNTSQGGTVLQFEFPRGHIGNQYSFSVIHHSPTNIQLRLYPLPGYPPKSSLHIYDFRCNSNGDLWQIYWVDGISNCWMQRIIRW